MPSRQVCALCGSTALSGSSELSGRRGVVNSRTSDTPSARSGASVVGVEGLCSGVLWSGVGSVAGPLGGGDGLLGAGDDVRGAAVRVRGAPERLRGAEGVSVISLSSELSTAPVHSSRCSSLSGSSWLLAAAAVEQPGCGFSIARTVNGSSSKPRHGSAVNSRVYAESGELGGVALRSEAPDQ